MNALAIREEMKLEELQTLGDILVKSGFFAETKAVAQAVVKVLAGRELGFPAIASVTGINVIKGKVSLSANLMAAAIKKSKKYNYRIRRLDETGCEIEFFEDGVSVGSSSFTKDDAKKAGLSGDNWTKYPRNMMFARAISNGAKFYCPDIFGGPVYTPDELGATVDGETGEVIDIPVEGAIEAEPEPTETNPPIVEEMRQVFIDQGKANEWTAFFLKHVASKRDNAKALEATLKKLQASGHQNMAEEIEGPMFKQLTDQGLAEGEILEKIAEMADGEVSPERMSYATLLIARNGLRIWQKELKEAA